MAESNTDLTILLASEVDAKLAAFVGRLLEQPGDVTPVEVLDAIRQFFTRLESIKAWTYIVEDWSDSQYIHFGGAYYLQGPKSKAWRWELIRALLLENALKMDNADVLSQLAASRGMPERKKSRKRVSVLDAFE